jgi:hypothetical protein
LIDMNLLAPDQLAVWLLGEVPYLERVTNCNLARLSRLLRILRFHAHDLNLKPSTTVYMRHGKGARRRSRFTKSGNLTAPRPEGRGFPIQRTQPGPIHMQTGFTDSPRADTASPAAKTLRAALMSRSWTAPHSGHTHARTLNGIDSTAVFNWLALLVRTMGLRFARRQWRRQKSQAL